MSDEIPCTPEALLGWWQDVAKAMQPEKALAS
jgi:hypothetical protein